VAPDPLASLVAGARRRANRRVLFEALSLGLLPAVGAVLLVRAGAIVGGPSPGMWFEGAGLLAGLVAGAVLHVRRRLDPSEAALLLDRRAGTRERCVTGLRSGGRVAEDALSHVDPGTVRRVLLFRPPRAALAVLLAAGALAGIHLLPGIGPAPVLEREGVEITVRTGATGAAGGGEERGPEDPTPDPEVEAQRVLALIRRAEAPLEDGAAADALRKAAAAAEKGDLDEARARLEAALAEARAGGDAASGDLARIERAFDASGGASAATAAPAVLGSESWGGDTGLVRRYLRLLQASRR